jgi:hypothetical protein
MELVMCAPMRLRRPQRLLTHTVFALLLGALWGCGGAAGEHPAPAYDDEQAPLLKPAPESNGEADASAGTCPSGVVRECKVLLSRQGSVENCFVGVQLCSDEAWGPCLSLDQLD